MKFIKKLGSKDYILYQLLRYIELIINSPYMILRAIISIISVIFDALNDLFYQERIIKLCKIKKINGFYNKCVDKLRKEDK